MYEHKRKRARKKREGETSLNSLARNARTFRKLSLSVRRICISLIFIYVLPVRMYGIKILNE